MRELFIALLFLLLIIGFSEAGVTVNLVVDGQPLNITQGTINIDVTTGTGPPPSSYCGDFICDESESCFDCPQDCGLCPPPPPPANTVNIGTRYPSVYSDGLAAYGSKQYHFVLDRNVTYVIMQMSSSDWSTNSDMIVSTNSTPANCSDMIYPYSKGIDGLWYGPSMNSNERIVIPITRQAGSIFYVTICNQSDITSRYSLFWNSS